MPHYSELLADVSKGAEPGQGDCGDQEEHGDGHMKLDGKTVARRASWDLTLMVTASKSVVDFDPAGPFVFLRRC